MRSFGIIIPFLKRFSLLALCLCFVAISNPGVAQTPSCQEIFARRQMVPQELHPEILKEMAWLFLEIRDSSFSRDLVRLYNSKVRELSEISGITSAQLTRRVQELAEELAAQQNEDHRPSQAEVLHHEMLLERERIPKIEIIKQTEISLDDFSYNLFTRQDWLHLINQKHGIGWTNDGQYVLIRTTDLWWDSSIFNVSTGEKISLPSREGFLGTDRHQFVVVDDNGVQIFDLDRQAVTFSAPGNPVPIPELFSSRYAVTKLNSLFRSPTFHLHHKTWGSPLSLSARFAYSQKTRRLAYFSFLGVQVIDLESGNRIRLPWQTKLWSESSPAVFPKGEFIETDFLTVFKGKRRFLFSLEDFSLRELPETHIKSLEHYGPVWMQPVISSNGTGIIHFYNMDNQQTVTTPQGRLLQKSSDGRWLLFEPLQTGTGSGKMNLLYDLNAMTSRNVPGDFKHFSFNNEWLMTDSEKGQNHRNDPLKVLALASGKQIAIEQASAVLPVHGDLWLTTHEQNDGPPLVTLNSIENRHLLGPQLNGLSATQFAVSPDGKTLVGPDDRHISIYRITPAERK